MVRYNLSFKGLRIPVICVIVLEVLWNGLEVIIDPGILDVPLHLLKYLLYALAGYIATKLYKTDNIGGAISGVITAGIGAVVEGLIISQLFFRSFFYTPSYGFPVVEGLTHVLSLAAIGGICGYIGSAVSVINKLDFIAYTLKFTGPRSDEVGIPAEQFGSERMPSVDMNTIPSSIKSRRAERVNSLHLSFTLSPPYGPHNPQSHGNLPTIRFSDGHLEITVFVQDDDGIPIECAQIKARLEAGTVWATYPLHHPDYDGDSSSFSHYEVAELGNGHYLVSIPTRWRYQDEPEIYDFATGDLYQVIVSGEKEGYVSSLNNIAAKFEVA